MENGGDLESVTLTTKEIVMANAIQALLITQIILFVIGVVLNVFTGVTLGRKGDALRPPDLFPYMLALMDCVVLAACFLRFTLGIAYLIFIDHSEAGVALFLKIEIYGRVLHVSAVPTSVWLTAAAVAERYVTTHAPFSGGWRHWNVLDKKKAQRVGLVILLGCEAFVVVFFIDWHFVPMETKLSAGYRYGVTYAILIVTYTVVCYVIPVVIGCVCYVKITCCGPPSPPTPHDGQEETPLATLPGDAETGAGTAPDNAVPPPPEVAIATPRSDYFQSTRAVQIVFPAVALLVPWLVMHARYYSDPLGASFETMEMLLLWTAENALVIFFASFKFLVYRFAWPDFRHHFLKHVCCK